MHCSRVIKAILAILYCFLCRLFLYEQVPPKKMVDAFILELIMEWYLITALNGPFWCYLLHLMHLGYYAFLKLYLNKKMICLIIPAMNEYSGCVEIIASKTLCFRVFRPSACPSMPKFPGIFVRTHEKNGLKLCMLVYLDHSTFRRGKILLTICRISYFVAILTEWNWSNLRFPNIFLNNAWE